VQPLEPPYRMDYAQRRVTHDVGAGKGILDVLCDRLLCAIRTVVYREIKLRSKERVWAETMENLSLLVETQFQPADVGPVKQDITTTPSP
jgi:hypothetical protein